MEEYIYNNIHIPQFIKYNINCPIGYVPERIHFAKFISTNKWYRNKYNSIEWNKYNLYSHSTHAEMALIISYLREHKIFGQRRYHNIHNIKYILNNINIPDTIIVFSIYKNKLHNSRPCDHCIKIMRLYNIKKVIYSTGQEENPFCMEYIKDMPLLGCSSGNRIIE